MIGTMRNVCKSEALQNAFEAIWSHVESFGYSRMAIAVLLLDVAEQRAPLHLEELKALVVERLLRQPRRSDPPLH
jgi:hypothetical protein